MTPTPLHPEPLIERERAGTLSRADGERLAAHRRACGACAAEAQLTDGFARELAPTDDDRARAAALVEAMFSNGAPSTKTDAPPPRMEAPAPRTGIALVISAAAHAALIGLAVLVGSWRAPGDFVDPLDVELVYAPTREAARPTPPANPSPALRPEVAPLPTRPRAPAVRGDAEANPNAGEHGAGGRSDGEPGAAGATGSEQSHPGGAEPGPGSSPGPALSPERLAVLLAPSRVARGGWTVQGAPSRTGPPAGRDVDRPGPSEAEIEARLGSGLRAEAMAREHLARTPPELRRRADGSHVYEGHRFEAVIHPDGSVSFDDHPNVSLNGISTSGSFDLGEAFMSAAGQDPHFAERQWFMRHTEELRHRLEAAQRRSEGRSALRRLRGRLERVWATTSRSAPARRARLFHIWDEMAEDDLGREARAIVLAFIRESLPLGDEHAYTDAELSRLNARRESEARFAPY